MNKLEKLINKKETELELKYTELGEHNQASEMENMLACDTQTEIDDIEKELKELKKRVNNERLLQNKENK